MLYSVKQRQNPLDREADSKYYASAEYGEEIDVTKLAKEISKSCTLPQLMLWLLSRVSWIRCQNILKVLTASD